MLNDTMTPEQERIDRLMDLDDPLHVSKQDRIENNEQRWQTIGLVHGVVLLLVAHTHTEADGVETIRIISARKADKTERRIYAEAH